MSYEEMLVDKTVAVHGVNEDDDEDVNEDVNEDDDDYY